MFVVALVAASALVGCSEAPTTLQRPNALCLAADGTLYVSDFHHQRIVALDAVDGRTRRVFGEQGLGTGDLWQVWDLTCDGEDVWALNQRVTGPDDSTQLVEAKHFDHSGSELSARQLQLPDAELKWLGSFTHLPDGSWVATDDERGALLFFGPDLAYRERWNGAKGGEAFKGPSFIRRRGDDLWLVEQAANRVRRLALDGRELSRFGREGRAPGEVLYPSSLDVCPDRWVVLADYGNYRIQRFTIASTASGILAASHVQQIKVKFRSFIIFNTSISYYMMSPGSVKKLGMSLTPWCPPIQQYSS